MEYLGAREPVVNLLNIDKGITTFARKISLNSSIKTPKIEQYKHCKYSKPFEKNITNTTNRAKKLHDRVPCVKQKKKKLIHFHVQKKGNTADKVSCLKKTKGTELSFASLNRTVGSTVSFQLETGSHKVQKVLMMKLNVKRRR